VVNRFRFGGYSERSHAEIARDLLAGFHRARHSLDRRPRALEALGRQLRLYDRLQRMQGTETGAARDERAECFLTLDAGEVKDDMSLGDDARLGERRRKRRDRIIADREDDDVSLGNPWRRLVAVPDGRGQWRR